MLRLGCVFLAYVLLFAALPVSGSASAAPHVHEIRFGVYKTKTRIVLDVLGAAKPIIFIRDNPPRLVIQLPEVTWSPRIHKTLRAGLVSRTDFRRLESGRAQIEFETRVPVRIKKRFALQPRPSESRFHRLVVDIEPVRPRALKPDQHRSGKPDRLAASPREVRARPAPDERWAAEHPSEKPLIMLDPGHGGIDPGATARSGMQEKHLVLLFARELQQSLLKTGRYRVRLTREKDNFVSLQKRVEMALNAKADLFISIHADAMPDSSFGGFSVYTRSEKPSDLEAARLAARENMASRIARPGLRDREIREVADILGHIGSRDARNSSAVFATTLIAELQNVGSGIPETHRSAGFAVLRTVLDHPFVPSILLELGYLTNQDDEQRLRQSEHRARLAAAIVRAVNRYFEPQPPRSMP